jgi:hypothetical protein
MKTTFEYFEIRSTNDNYGLVGRFDTTEQVLEEINRSYKQALENGYDNKNNKWIIVCNQVSKEFDDSGLFLKEETCRFIIEHVEFSFYDNAFVFVY